MLTSDDLKQIKNVVKEVTQPEFDSIRTDMKSMEFRLTQNMKDYVQDAGETIISAVEDMFKLRDGRLERLEKLHPVHTHSES